MALWVGISVVSVLLVAYLATAFFEGWWPFKGWCLPGSVFYQFCDQGDRDADRNQRVADIEEDVYENV
jgi:hypothetical protein